MSNGTPVPEPAPIHPVAPRLKNGSKIPHIGPHINAYRLAHAETVGHESDKWWAKVRRHTLAAGSVPILTRDRPRARRSLGTGPSTPYAQGRSRTATSSGFPRAASTHHITAWTAGRTNILTRSVALLTSAPFVSPPPARRLSRARVRPGTRHPRARTMSSPDLLAPSSATSASCSR
jgi:hypothetical protein